MDARATGELIARRRRVLGMSQGELAERLHVTDKAVSKWETGRGMPGIDSLEPLAETLGLSVSELLSGRELTAEELPKAAGGQIVESMKRGWKMAWRGVLATVLTLALLTAGYMGLHYCFSTTESDTDGLARQAERYLGGDGLHIVETERRGDWLAALCTDDQGTWCLCVYDRDKVFPDRWRANGGKHRMEAGRLDYWSFADPQRAVLILCGGELPEKAKYYTFLNGGITYTCSIEDRRVLDIFILPDMPAASIWPWLKEEDGQLLEELPGVSPVGPRFWQMP